jgi:hypothetical protein
VNSGAGAYEQPDCVGAEAHGEGEHNGLNSSTSFNSYLVREPWPEPMDPAALHGLAGDVVRTIEPHSESDPAAILIQFLVAFGNAIGRTAYFRAEADHHHTNLFTVMVGNTSKGRKGTSWGQVARLLRLTFPEWWDCVVSGLVSGEGLVWQVRDSVTKSTPVCEGKGKDRRIVRYEEVVADEGVSDKRLLVLESEFASVLKVAAREKNTLTTVVRQAWDTGELRTMAKNSPAVATGAHVSIIGHITRDELRRQITDTDMANGVANRFLWMCVHRSKCLPEGGELREESLEPLAARVKLAADFARGIQQVERDPAARAMWRAVYEPLSTGKPGLLGAATSRAEAQVMRIALLYALLDCSPVIRREHLSAGLAVWTYSEQSTKYVFGSALGDPTADAILAALLQNPSGVSRTEISSLFGRNKSAGEITRALGLLFEYRLAYPTALPTDGRSIEIWHPGFQRT